VKKVLLIFNIIICLFCMPLTSFANNTDEEQAKQEYEDAISENWKEMLEVSIQLDILSAENKSYHLNWMALEETSEESKKIVDRIQKLEAEQEEAEESMEPYTNAKKACDEKLNADGANAALENIIRIEKDLLKDQEALNALWKTVTELQK
jgi:hypothetical protein